MADASGSLILAVVNVSAELGLQEAAEAESNINVIAAAPLDSTRVESPICLLVCPVAARSRASSRNESSAVTRGGVCTSMWLIASRASLLEPLGVGLCSSSEPLPPALHEDARTNSNCDTLVAR